jgi:hypothetical protein
LELDISENKKLVCTTRIYLILKLEVMRYRVLAKMKHWLNHCALVDEFSKNMAPNTQKK